MAEKLQRAVIAALICLAGYLIYDMYGGEIYQYAQSFYQEWSKMAAEKGQETEGKARVRQIPERQTQESQIQEEWTEKSQKEEPFSGKLPARYDAREHGIAPVVKDQGELGICWAVTASSALEASLLPERKLEFSADHISSQNAYGKTIEEGGNYMMAVSYLAGWLGPVTEEEDAYRDGRSPDGQMPVCHVQEMQMLLEKDIRKIKRLVYRYGAIQTSCYMDQEGERHSSIYYNEFSHAYCYAGDQKANHDILILGWDDDYPKENFSVNVKHDGAFICQNSWGEDFGENGCFYISYEDAVMGNACVAYTKVEEAQEEKKIYQTDLCGWIGQIGYDSEECYFANVYTAGQMEELTAVGFYATGGDTEYTVYVAETFQGRASLIGKTETASGKLKNPGYYTVELAQPIRLSEGQKFAVLVKIRTPDSHYPVATEYPADENSRNVILEDGEGYISSNGIIWNHTEEEYKCNVCLKAYSSKILQDE